MQVEKQDTIPSVSIQEYHVFFVCFYFNRTGWLKKRDVPPRCFFFLFHMFIVQSVQSINDYY